MAKIIEFKSQKDLNLWLECLGDSIVVINTCAISNVSGWQGTITTEISYIVTYEEVEGIDKKEIRRRNKKFRRLQKISYLKSKFSAIFYALFILSLLYVVVSKLIRKNN